MMKSWYCSYFPNDRITIHASKLASCTGHNPFTEVNEVAAKQAIEALPVEQMEQIKSTMATSFADTTQVATALKTIEAMDLKDETIIAKVTKEVFCKHGTEKEASIRAAIPERIKTSNKYRVSLFPVITLPSGLDVFIGGKHDGVKEDGSIVEIKTRQYKFLGVRDYERVQVHAYMFIFNTTKAQLVENFNGESKTHDIEFDHMFWNQVEEKLHTFLTDHDM